MPRIENLLLAGAMLAPAARAAGPPVPVLVEMFTSEGCSSCPPADELLRSLAAGQPMADILIVPLEFHVDYWDQGGWRDRFSDGAYTRRQAAYVRAFRQGAPYTPEMVVDGAEGFVGSDRPRAITAIAEAARRPLVPMELSVEGEVLRIRFPAALPEDASVMLALTEEGLSTRVGGGENAGREVRHAAVVRSLAALGSPRAEMEAPLRLAPGWRKEKLKAVVFLQDRSTRRVVGIAVRPLQGP